MIENKSEYRDKKSVKDVNKSISNRDVASTKPLVDDVIMANQKTEEENYSSSQYYQSNSLPRELIVSHADNSDTIVNSDIKLSPQDSSQTFYHHLISILQRNKGRVIIYATWLIINFSFLLLGGEGEKRYPRRAAKELFFPFSGKASNYDVSEFFIYVIAFPVVIYAVCYFLRSFKKSK